MIRQHLPTLQLRRLDKKQHGDAVGALSFAMDRALPEGLLGGRTEQIVEFSLAILQGTGRGSVANSLETFASYFSVNFLSYLLTLPHKVSYKIGNVTLVENTRQFNLVALLTRLQVTLGDTHLRLVDPAILFSDACYNYRWRGTIFRFAFGAGGRMPADYVAWHPSSTYDPKSVIGLSISRVQHRKNSDDRGQD